MLLGHKTGIRDNYLKRKPSMVADAVAAIERHYFPAKPKDKGKTTLKCKGKESSGQYPNAVAD